MLAVLFRPEIIPLGVSHGYKMIAKAQVLIPIDGAELLQPVIFFDVEPRWYLVRALAVSSQNVPANLINNGCTENICPQTGLEESGISPFRSSPHSVVDQDDESAWDSFEMPVHDKSESPMSLQEGASCLKDAKNKVNRIMSSFCIGK
jgi:hypothetical protein